MAYKGTITNDGAIGNYICQQTISDGSIYNEYGGMINITSDGALFFFPICE